MKVLLACGGTGGHIFPGLALAESFEEKVPGVELVFVGTPRGMEKEIVGKTHWRLEMTEAVSWVDKKGFARLGALGPFARSLWAARRLLKKEMPQLVVGSGGYASLPVLGMASWLRIPTFTLEPNAVPGMANRALKFFVDRVVVAYPGMEKFFNSKKLLSLGIPVRKNLFREKETVETKRVFLVFGGSQGAQKINEGLLNALDILRDLKDKIHWIHQVGKAAPVEAFEKAYREKGFSAEVYPFIDDMGKFYAKAHFVIARAGANTVAELAALHKPSLLVPYPFATGGHQEANARFLESAGGAQVLLNGAVNGETLAKAVREVVETPSLLKMMEANLAKLEANKAAERIVEECLKYV